MFEENVKIKKIMLVAMSSCMLNSFAYALETTNKQVEINDCLENIDISEDDSTDKMPELLRKQFIINDLRIASNKTSLHKVGHFLYEEIVPRLSDNERNQITQSYIYWKQLNMKCYNKEETFCMMYEWYKTNIEVLSSEENKLFEKIERMCFALY